MDRVSRYLRRTVPFALLFILLIALPNFLLDGFIYYPEPYSGGPEWTPEPIDFDMEDVFFEASDGTKLHAWYARSESGGPQPNPRVTILWFHGNAGNIAHRYHNLAQMVERLGVDVFLMDYRGYGRSEGKPSEEGLYLDGEAAYR